MKTLFHNHCIIVYRIYNEEQSNREMITKYKDLTFNILCDIYNIHKCFLFANYHFQLYSIPMFRNSIDRELKSYARFIPTVNLYPQYVIDDDLHTIWKYLFAASYLLQDQIQNNKTFTLKICIIPHRIVSIYDENILFPIHITNVEEYLKSKNVNMSLIQS